MTKLVELLFLATVSFQWNRAVVPEALLGLDFFGMLANPSDENPAADEETAAATTTTTLATRATTEREPRIRGKPKCRQCKDNVRKICGDDGQNTKFVLPTGCCIESKCENGSGVIYEMEYDTDLYLADACQLMGCCRMNRIEQQCYICRKNFNDKMIRNETPLVAESCCESSTAVCAAKVNETLHSRPGLLANAAAICVQTGCCPDSYLPDDYYY